MDNSVNREKPFRDLLGSGILAVAYALLLKNWSRKPGKAINRQSVRLSTGWTESPCRPSNEAMAQSLFGFIRPQIAHRLSNDFN